MMNIPIELNNKRIFVIGMGGGFDILGAIPFVNTYNIIGMANLNTKFRGFTSCESSQYPDSIEYLLQELTGIPMYIIAKEGVKNVRKGYERIKEIYSADVLLLVDGGVDSIMRGDEEGPGTLLEDSVSLRAAADLPTQEKYLVCYGFGTELEEGVCHYRALENIAALTKDGSFLGSCSMTTSMLSFQYYKTIAEEAFAVKNRKSHIHSRVIPAVEGNFGKLGIINDAAIPGVESQDAWINPLMSIVWFFNLAGVDAHNMLAKQLEQTNTWTDVMIIYKQWKQSLQVRPTVSIPL